MILCCGDALIDFVPAITVDGSDAVRAAVGGSCLNVAVGLARLAAPTGFVGGIANDLFGRMIAQHALASNVDLGFATRSDRQTTLAFVRIIAAPSAIRLSASPRLRAPQTNGTLKLFLSM